MSDETPWSADEFAIGSRVAGYRLDEEIGRGGMAVVYRAQDPRLDRRVALKILAPGLARDEEFRQRFIRESRAAAAVDHPHIIPVFGAGEADGVLFIAMRYVDGQDARTLIEQEGQLPPALVADIIAQVASALDAAHAHGLVHRDVKPANMLIDSTGGTGRLAHVYLSDFGLSKQALSSTHLTATGQFLGTLDYVAPEQIEGRRVDGRADQYALACAAFEMLAGNPPFTGDQRLAVMWAQLSQAPPALTASRPDLPAAVDEVLAKALAKSPDERYPRCLDFAAALREACLPGLATAGGDSAPAAETSPGTPGLGPPAGAPGPAGAAAGPAASAGQPRPATEVSGTSRPHTEVSGASGPGAEPAASPAEGGAAPDSPPRPGTEVSHPPRRPRELGRPAREPDSPAPGGPATDFDALFRPAPTPSAGPLPPTGPQRPQSSRPAGGRPPGRPAADPRPPGGGRPRWRSPVVLVTAGVLVIGLAGAAFALTRGGGGGTIALTAPGCSTKTATAGLLRKIHPHFVTVPGKPFAVAVTPAGHSSFATLGKSNAIAVLPVGAAPAPTFAETIPVAGAPQGAVITPDGRYLLAATGGGATVLNVALAEQGSLSSVAGTLTAPGGGGAVEVAVSTDGRFAFVTLQNNGTMAVFNLHAAIAGGFASAHLVGTVPLGYKPTGMAVTADGQWLYVTTQRRTKTARQGTLSLISVHKAETKPASSVVATASAGCDPVRVITTDNGQHVWVTARASNYLLGFSAGKLRSDPSHALVARVQVGQAPIGLAGLENGSRIIVANSNMSGLKPATPGLAVIDTAAALNGKHALLGLIRSHLLPRQFALEGNGKTLLVTNSSAHQLEAVDVTHLP